MRTYTKSSPPTDVVMFNLEKRRAFYFRHNPFQTWQTMFGRFCRSGMEMREYRNNNNVKVYPWDDEHSRFYKAAAYYRKKPQDNNGWQITYYPLMVYGEPNWIAITKSDVDYGDWCDWCRDNNAVGAALNADYLQEYGDRNSVAQEERREAKRIETTHNVENLIRLFQD